MTWPPKGAQLGPRRSAWEQGDRKICAPPEEWVGWSRHFLFLLFLFSVFLGLHPRHMEVPRLGVRSELQLPACATATATRALSRSLQPTPQFMAMPDPLPTERGQGSNLRPHGS